MKLLANVADGKNRSLSNIDVVIGCIFGKDINKVQPLVSGDLNNCDVRNHICTRSYNHSLGVN